MKVSLRWLTEFVDLPDDVARITNALAELGHEVEGVEELVPDWSGVVVARVEDVSPHPDADKIRLCQVSTGGDPVPVVCGAWNFEAGAVVAYAEPGAVLPGGFEIGVRDIRGVRSNGMICSEKELGLGDDHTGILVLDPDSPVGEDFATWVELPDTIIDLTITPNRPDAMSMVGIARDLAAYFDTPVRRPDSSTPTVEGTPSMGVEIADPSGCYRFTLRELDGVSIGPSPFWMRRRLRAAGVRPISNIVDVTNYVMIELGHPLHAFDADRVQGDRLIVRQEGETLETLDGVVRSLVTDDLVICDAEGPTSLAGTMGGADSEVADDTSRVLLEAASWDPPTIMWMSRRHGLRSEASARFERGVDPNLPVEASARAARLMLETAGGALRSEVLDEIAVPKPPLELTLTVSDVTRVLGDGFTPGEIAGLLRSIELGVSEGDPMTVTVPTFRPDLTRPIDLVEEVARLKGYESFPDTVPTGAAGGWTEEQRRTRLLRGALAGAGLHQAVNLSFLGLEDLDAFAYPSDHPARRVIQVTNPLREEEGGLRTALLPGLLRSLRYNRSRGVESASLFEVGKVFFARPAPEDPRIPDQPDRLAFALAGQFGGRGPDRQARGVDVYTATALWRLIATRLGLEEWELVATEEPGFHPGRAAAVVLHGERIGVVGEIHPVTVATYDLAGRVAGGELDLAPLVAPQEPHLLAPPSPFPPVEFDLAFIVDLATPASRLLRVTTEAGSPLVESARVFDEYTELGDGRKSLAVRYTLRAPDRTLTNDEAAGVRRSMVEAARQLGAELRGQA